MARSRNDRGKGVAGGRGLTRPVVIALDGPAGVGKSTVGDRLARRLGYFYFDTGVLYRAVALGAVEQGLDLLDERGLADLVAHLNVQVRPPSVADGRQYDVLLAGRDVSSALRTPSVDGTVSAVAASTAVRGGLIERQRHQVLPPGTVMVGRDIGTVVCPDADLKLFLRASVDERALRRQRQLGLDVELLDEVRRAIEERDRLDSTRSLAPLSQADDAIVIDTEGVAVDDVVELAIEHLADRKLVARGREARGADTAERPGG